MRDNKELTARIIDSFDRTQYTPYSAWSQHYFNSGGSETHEGLAFCAARSEELSVEQFIAAAIFRVLNFFDYSREEIREMLASACVQPSQALLENCDAWHGLANTRIQGSADMLAALRVAHPNLQPVFEVFNLTGYIESFTVATNDKSYVALYWYTTG